MNVQECYTIFHGDYENAKVRLMNDKIIEKFLLKFLNDDTMPKLIAAVANHDHEESFVAAHTMKGVAGNLAFTELRKNVSELTEQLRSREQDADPELFKAVVDSYNLIIDTINKAKES